MQLQYAQIFKNTFEKESESFFLEERVYPEQV